MKKLLFVLFAALFTLNLSAQDAKEKLWENAAVDYAAGNYTSAASRYDSIVKQGGRSWELYYNLGAAYFKDNELGRAILNFERALSLDPGNEDIEHNLAVANVRTVDKIESVPQFFVVEWITALGKVFNADTWAVIAVVLLAVVLALIVLWRIKSSRVAFVCAIVGAVLMVVAFLYAHNARSTMGHSDSAIIVNTASVVRSSPDSGGKELFVLHEGTKVDVVDQIGSWVEVRIASGNKGWIVSTDMEKI